MFLMVIKLDIQTRRNNDINIYLCLLACYIENITSYKHCLANAAA